MNNLIIKNNEIFFSENEEKKRIGYNKSNLPYLGFLFKGKWYYQHLNGRYTELLHKIKSNVRWKEN